MIHYKMTVEYRFDEEFVAGQTHSEYIKATGFFVTLGALASDIYSAVNLAAERIDSIAQAPGRVALIEVSEIALEALSSHVFEAAKRSQNESIYYSTGRVFYPQPDRVKPWWKFLAR
jgi:hypothetical protein